MNSYYMGVRRVEKAIKNAHPSSDMVYRVMINAQCNGNKKCISSANASTIKQNKPQTQNDISESDNIDDESFGENSNQYEEDNGIPSVYSGSYYIISLGGVIPSISFANMSGFEDISVTNNQVTKQTFSIHHKYAANFALSAGLGFNINKYGTYRIETIVSYARLAGNIDQSSVITNTAANPGSSFHLPQGFGNMHFFSLDANFYTNLFNKNNMHPSIGIGVGGAALTFDKYMNKALLAPTFNAYLGFNYHLQYAVLSLGYRFRAFYNKIPSLGANVGNLQQMIDENQILANDRPLQNNYTTINGIFFHCIELSLAF